MFYISVRKFWTSFIGFVVILILCMNCLFMSLLIFIWFLRAFKDELLSSLLSYVRCKYFSQWCCFLVWIYLWCFIAMQNLKIFCSRQNYHFLKLISSWFLIHNFLWKNSLRFSFSSSVWFGFSHLDRWLVWKLFLHKWKNLIVNQFFSKYLSIVSVPLLQTISLPEWLNISPLSYLDFRRWFGLFLNSQSAPFICLFENIPHSFNSAFHACDVKCFKNKQVKCLLLCFIGVCYSFSS